MRKMSFSDKERNKSTIQSLSQALGNRDKSVINTGTVTMPQGSQREDDVWDGAGSALNGAFKLGKSLYDSGLFNKGSDSTPEQYQFLSNSNFGSSPSDGTLFGGYNLGGANAGSGALQTSEMPTFSGFGSEAGSSLGSSMGGGGFNGMGLIGPAIGGAQGFAKTGDWQGGVQGMFGVDEDDSDVMQSINGAKNGAMTGFSVGGPWGALIGGILGLGSSFIDDI